MKIQYYLLKYVNQLKFGTVFVLNIVYNKKDIPLE